MQNPGVLDATWVCNIGSKGESRMHACSTRTAASKPILLQSLFFDSAMPGAAQAPAAGKVAEYMADAIGSGLPASTSEACARTNIIHDIGLEPPNLAASIS